MYKKETVKVASGKEGYSERSGGGYSGGGHGGDAYTGGDSLDSGGYTSDDIHDGDSDIVSYQLLYTGYSRDLSGGYAAGYQVSRTGYNGSVYKVRRGYGERVLYAKHGYAKRLPWTRYDKKGAGYIKKVSYRKEDWLYKRQW